ncbi:AI-2E family transporter [Aureimonas altamirensis]|uniref:AI-2E family transporter n=1 Tax=Aureimonas altamirensis TaxID=370622 RepID=UPI0030193935
MTVPQSQDDIVPGPRADRLRRVVLWLVATTLVLMLLIQARVFLLPLVIAVLVFSLTAALIDWILSLRLGAIRFPQWLASTVAVCLVGATLLSLSAILSGQIDRAITIAPAYVERAQTMLAGIIDVLDDQTAQGLINAIQDFRIHAYLRSAAGSAGQLLLMTILVILYVAFLFTEKPWMAGKLSSLVRDTSRAADVTAVVAAIRKAIHHYLLVKAAVSAVTGVTVYAILRSFSIEFAETLALLTILLNFIPNVGSIVASVLAVLIGAIQLGDIEAILMLTLLVSLAQFVLGNVVDPMMMGRSLRMSPFGIIVSLTFWGAIWGIAGMFLAVPLMVMIAIICAHTPSLSLVAVLLSRDGCLPGDAGTSVEGNPP